MSVSCVERMGIEMDAIEDTHLNCCRGGTISLIVIALFIIGSIGAAGHFPGSALGWTTIGLGAGMLLIHLSMGQFKERKFMHTIIDTQALLYIVLGALTVTAFLSGKQLGYGLVILHLPVPLVVPCFGAFMCLLCYLERK